MRTKRPARAVSDFRYSPLVAAVSLAFGGQAAHAGNTFTVSVQGDRPLTAPTTPNTLRDAIEFFNIADAAITIGVLLILARSFLSREKPAKTPKSTGDTAPESQNHA